MRPASRRDPIADRGDGAWSICLLADTVEREDVTSDDVIIDRGSAPARDDWRGRGHRGEATRYAWDLITLDDGAIDDGDQRAAKLAEVAGKAVRCVADGAKRIPDKARRRVEARRRRVGDGPRHRVKGPRRRAADGLRSVDGLVDDGIGNVRGLGILGMLGNCITRSAPRGVRLTRSKPRRCSLRSLFNGDGSHNPVLALTQGYFAKRSAIVFVSPRTTRRSGISFIHCREKHLRHETTGPTVPRAQRN